jgi:hypothetical protein
MPYRKNEFAETKRTPSKCDNKCVCTCGHVCAEHHWFNSEFIECRAGHCRCPKFTYWESTKLEQRLTAINELEQRLTAINDRIGQSERQIVKAWHLLVVCLVVSLVSSLLFGLVHR